MLKINAWDRPTITLGPSYKFCLAVHRIRTRNFGCPVRETMVGFDGQSTRRFALMLLVVVLFSCGTATKESNIAMCGTFKEDA